MGFSANAVGFYLQLDDTMSPGLAVASKNYEKFVTKIDKLNTAAFTASKKGLGDIGRMAQAYAKQSAKALSSMGGAKRAPQMAVDLTVTPRSKKALRTLLSELLGAAFGKATLRLSAAVPNKRMPAFDGSSSLRSQYKAMTQPPDMSGHMNIPKFAKGGMVGGPDGIDKVLALLTKGEMVLPKDAAKQLQEMAGAAQGSAGKFTAFPKELAEAYARAESLLKVMPKLKAAIATGLDPKAALKYNMVQKELARLDKVLIVDQKTLSVNYKTKLSPALVNLRDRLKDAGKETVKTETVMNKWLKSIAGSTGFMAVHTAMKTLQDDFLNVRSAAEELTQATGLDKAADGLVDNFNSINKVLHLSRDGLSALRKEFLGMMETMPLAVRDIDATSEAMESLIKSGIDKHIAVNLAGSVHLLNAATTTGAENAAKMAIMFSQQLKLGVGDSADAMANFSKIAAAAGISGDVLSASVLAAAKNGELFLASLSPKEAQKSLESIARLTAAFEKSAEGSGAQIGEALLGALQDPKKLTALSGVFRKTEGELAEALTSGNLEGFFEQLEIEGPMSANAFAEALGGNVDAVRLLMTDTVAMNALLAKTNVKLTETGKGFEDMGADAVNSMTSFAKLQKETKNSIQGYGYMPDIIAFFKDLNPLAIISAGYLAGKLLPVLGLVAMGFGKLGQGIWWVVKLLRFVPALLTPVITGLGVLAQGAMWVVKLLRFLPALLTLVTTGVRLLTVALIANPIGAIIAGLVTAGTLIWYFWDDISAFADWFGGKFVDMIRPVGKFFGEIFGGWWDSIKNIWGGIKDIGAALLNWDMTALLAGLKRVGAAILDYILTPLNVILSKFGIAPIKIGSDVQVTVPQHVEDVSAGSMLSPERVTAMASGVAVGRGDSSVLSAIHMQLQEQTRVMKQPIPNSAEPAQATTRSSPSNNYLQRMSLGQAPY